FKTQLEKIEKTIELNISQGKPIGYLLLEKSGIYYLERDYATSLSLLENALKIFIDEEDKLNSAITYNEMGLIQEELGFFDNSILNFSEAIEILEYLNDYKKLIKVNNNLANVYNLLNDFEHSYEYYEKALKVAQKENLISEEIKTTSNLVEILFKIRDYDKINRILQRNLDYFKEIKDPYGVIITLQKFGKLNYFLGPSYFNKAFQYIKESLELISRIQIGENFSVKNRAKLEWECFLYLGKIKLSWKIYKEAENYLLKSLESIRNFEVDDDSIIEGIVLESLGDLYKKTNDLKKAIQYYKLAGELYYNFGNDIKQAEYKTKIANIYLIDDYDVLEAINYLEGALNIYQDLNFIKESAEILHKLGDIYINREINELAISYLQEARESYHQILDEYHVKLLDEKIKSITDPN
ncbi:MAG: tetratricopeptide repeat protein, partial [Candidatus Hermodarchaeota archaeon]